MLHILLDLLFPRTSLTGTEGSFVTPAEQRAFRFTPLLLHKEELLRRGLHHIDAIVAAGQYDESEDLKNMILTYKYRHVPAFAEELAMAMDRALANVVPNDAASSPTLCAVPLHWIRKNERGFNQAAELAIRIANRHGWQMEELLFRTRRTGHQAKRSRAERLTAMIGAFAMKPKAVAPEWVMLIDDIATTGATLDECARMLKCAGAKRVTGLVAAAG
jgi:ComF family protein